MKTIRMLSNEVGADGESLEAGFVYPLNDASADRWLRRGKAEEVPATAEARVDPVVEVPIDSPFSTSIETAVRAVAKAVANGGVPDADAPRGPNKPGPKPKAAK